MKNVDKRIADIGVVPVIKLANPGRDAEPLAGALCEGGVPVAEVTFRAAGAEKAIETMRRTHPEILVGAGTVLTTEQIDKAVSAGAQFIVSPGFDPELVGYCVERDIPVYPGCTTPSEYQAAIKFGLEVLKFFPAEQSGGIAKIKAMSAPFPMVKVMPTGGISLKNLKEYISCKAVCACGGSYMVTADLIENGRFGEITDLCRRSVEIVKEARQ
ncbi:MAG: bifunctional 4-hydroxy-2-oxoglutarate aldolase/2-dehydro-3-deoxy-phosphogluconate aldolase [Clostridia bacterium]|nr:bifunctional 4-hydroxy-2-oxoglutarate aldolase/2-dehydro-3-deoxy-phosphogluconate aldolase [Clostridia bacterium]